MEKYSYFIFIFVMFRSVFHIMIIISTIYTVYFFILYIRFFTVRNRLHHCLGIQMSLSKNAKENSVTKKIRFWKYDYAFHAYVKLQLSD